LSQTVKNSSSVQGLTIAKDTKLDHSKIAPVIGRICPTEIGEPVVFTVVGVEPELDELQTAASRLIVARLAMTFHGFRDMSLPVRAQMDIPPLTPITWPVM
jgi:hypothetical protein